MEEVYVVKVKTRPEPSKLYPSERRYSAVTVGGLGLVHALLAVTSLLLATLGIASEGAAASYGAGIALGVAGCGAAVVGVLAWRRWYVDNNIRYFLVTSLVSGVAAIVCIVLTAVALATMQEDIALHRLSLRQKLPIPLPLVATEATYQDAMYDDDYDDHNNTELIQKFILAFETRKNRSDYQNIPSNETLLVRLDDYERELAEEETQTVPNVNPIQIEKYNNMKVFEQREEETEGEMGQDLNSAVSAGDDRTNPSTSTEGSKDVLPIVRYHNEEIIHEDVGKEVRNVLSINILIASFLELAWSLLSMRIAWKGMTNDYPEDDANNRVVEGSEKSKSKMETGYLPKFMKSDKPKARDRMAVRGPDIISNHQAQRHNGKKRINVAVISDDVEHYLPQEESTTEYHERVRRFLASNNENAC